MKQDQTGTPASLPGVEIEKVDELHNRLDQISNDNLDERLPGLRHRAKSLTKIKSRLSVILQDWNEMDGVLKNFFDVIWQSFGTFGSPNYDENRLRIRDICRLTITSNVYQKP